MMNPLDPLIDANEGDRPRSLLVDALRVEIYPSHRLMAKAAAQAATACIERAVRAKGHARVILASAASQILFLDALVKTDGIPWANVTLFHMDEYLGIHADHPASFRRFLRERVEAVVHPAAFHGLAGDALEPITECERYGALLDSQPIDLCCLGVGENGHIAFNDPDVADFDDPRTVKIVKLDQACRCQQVGEGAFPHLDAVPQYALTLTIPALCRSETMLCICPELRKARAVKAMIQGPVASACPASILRRTRQSSLLLDSDSANLL